jgi:hypothetical protein
VRYGIAGLVTALQMLLASSTFAGMIQFEMDFDLFCTGSGVCDGGPFAVLDGPFEDAGQFNIDDSLLNETTQTLVSFGQIQGFSLSFPAPFFSYDAMNLASGFCQTGTCGMLFTGTRFDGFTGEFSIVDGLPGSLLRFDVAGINLELIDGITLPAGCMNAACVRSTDGVAFGLTRISAAPIPEPASWLLLLGGGAWVSWRARRRTSGSSAPA